MRRSEQLQLTCVLRRELFFKPFQLRLLLLSSGPLLFCCWRFKGFLFIVSSFPKYRSKHFLPFLPPHLTRRLLCQGQLVWAPLAWPLCAACLVRRTLRTYTPKHAAGIRRGRMIPLKGLGKHPSSWIGLYIRCTHSGQSLSPVRKIVWTNQAQRVASS